MARPERFELEAFWRRERKREPPAEILSAAKDLEKKWRALEDDFRTLVFTERLPDLSSTVLSELLQ